MGCSRKNPNRGGGLRIYFFENPLDFFNFFTLPLEVPDKTKLNPWIFHKIVLDPLEIPRPKTKTPGNSTLLLITLGNSTSFLINPWKFHMLFLWYPWKFHIHNPPPPCLEFFRNSPTVAQKCPNKLLAEFFCTFECLLPQNPCN